MNFFIISAHVLDMAVLTVWFPDGWLKAICSFILPGKGDMCVSAVYWGHFHPDKHPPSLGSWHLIIQKNWIPLSTVDGKWAEGGFGPPAAQHCSSQYLHRFCQSTARCWHRIKSLFLQAEQTRAQHVNPAGIHQQCKCWQPFFVCHWLHVSPLFSKHEVKLKLLFDACVFVSVRILEESFS